MSRIRKNMMRLSEQQMTALRNGEAVRTLDEDLECVSCVRTSMTGSNSCCTTIGDWTDDELRRALAQSAEANGWNEPEMDAYDNYDEQMAKQCR